MPEIIHIDPNGDLIIHLGHDPTPTPAAQTPTNGAEQLQVQSPKAMSLFGGPSSGAPPALAAQTPTNGAEQPQVQSPKARSLFGGPSSGAAPAPASTATPQADLSNILPHLATVSASNPTGTPKIESAFAGVSTAATPSAPTGSLFQSLRVETKTLFPTTANNKQPVQLLVSLKHVTLACGRAKAVFGGRFRESKAEEDGLLHWRLGSHFEPEAVKMVMNVIHGYTKSLPDHVSLGRLTAIAAVVDDLACHDSVWFVAKSWICKLPAKPPATPIHDLPSWILVSFVFHEPELFTSATRLTIMHSSDPISAGELPIYPSIIAEMEKSKQSHLKKLIASLENLKVGLSRGTQNSSCPVECRAMLLGSLIQGMDSAAIVPFKLPSQPLVGRSVASTMMAIRQLQSPCVYMPGSEPNSRNVWRRDYSHLDLIKAPPKTLIQHPCSLQQILEPEVRSTELEVVGLSLTYFVSKRKPGLK